MLLLTSLPSLLSAGIPEASGIWDLANHETD